jgi:hypothetical protein
VLRRSTAASHSQVQTTIGFLEHPDLTEGKVGTSHSSGDKFLQQLFERQLVRGVKEHLHRIVGIKAAIACWFHAAKAATLRTIRRANRFDFSIFSIFSNRVLQKRNICK